MVTINTKPMTAVGHLPLNVRHTNYDRGPTGDVAAHVDVHWQALPQRHRNCMVNLLVCITKAGDLHLQ